MKSLQPAIEHDAHSHLPSGVRSGWGATTRVGNRSFLVTAALCSVALVGISCRSEEQQAPRAKFNLMLIVADSLRADVLPFHGGTARTPHLDWLVENGALIENAYSTAPWTMDSSLSMFTGNYADIYQIETRMFEQKSFLVPDAKLLLAEVLAAQNYKVQFYSENPLLERSNKLQGFESFAEPEEVGSIQNVVAAIKTLSSDQNFYLVKWFMDPHWPYLPEPRFRPEKPETLKLKTHFYAQLRNFVGKKLPPDQMQFTRDLYAGEVASVDARVGLILDALRDKDLLDSTFVIFTSDHGDEFRDHKGWGHGSSYYQELVHVPLVVMGPGIEKGLVIRQSLSHIDLMPTLSELLDLDFEGDFQGESYASLLLGQQPGEDRLIYLSGEHKKRLDVSDAVVFRDHKLILSRDSQSTTLYDLKADPGETKDTSDDDKELTARLNHRLHAVRRDNRARKHQIEFARERSASALERENRERDETIRAMKAIGYIE